MNYYPLKAIVTTNQVLAAQYENDPYSAFMTSGCLSPEELSNLLDQGASFDVLVFVNGEGHEIMAQLEGAKPIVPIRAMQLAAASVDPTGAQEAVRHLHKIINPEHSFFDIGG